MTSSRSPAFLKELLARVVLVLGSLTLCLLGCELAATLLPEVEYLQLRFHPVYGITMRPNLRLPESDDKGPYEFRINSLGFRGPEWEALPATGPRLLVVGDSFVSGWLVREEDTIPGAAAIELSALTGASWLGIGMGVDDWGTAQELLALRQHLRELKPSVVVLALYSGNDLANNAPALAGRTLVSATDPIRPYLIPGPDGALRPWSRDPFRAALRRRSQLYRVIERRLMPSAQGRESRHWAEADAGRLPPFEHWEVYRTPLRPEWEEAWTITWSLVREIRREVEAMGARFALLHVPALEQVEFEFHTAFWERRYQLRIGDGASYEELLDMNAPMKRISDLAGRDGIQSFDPTPILRRWVRETGRTAYRHDGHFTREAYRMVGKFLGQLLAEGGAGPQVDEPRPTDLLALHEFLDASGGEPPIFAGYGLEKWDADGLVAEPDASLMLPRPRQPSRLVVEGILTSMGAATLTARVDNVPAQTWPLPGPGPFRFVTDRALDPRPGRSIVVGLTTRDPTGRPIEPGRLLIRRIGFCGDCPGLSPPSPETASSRRH